MMFKEWLFNEMKHISFEDKPIHLKINGNIRLVTGIDFKWEDFGQQKLVVQHFVQEFPYDVGTPGQFFVNAGYWGNNWVEQLPPNDLHRLRQQKKVFGDSEFKQILVGKTPTFGPEKPLERFDVNPLDAFNKIDPHTILEPDGSPAQFRTPYDKKPILTWWDFVEVTSGNDVVKHPARVR